MAKVTTLKKAGRPAKTRTVRISPRFPENVAEALQRAADLRGVSVASFVVDSAQRAADRVIEEELRWRLDEAETSKLAALLATPPQLTTAARTAQALATDVEIRS